MDKSLEKLVNRLEDLLRQQTVAQGELTALLSQKRTALRAGKGGVLADLTARENEQVRQISLLETQRLSLMGDLTLHLNPAAKAPLRLSELADRLAEPARGRLLVLRHQLRKAAERARHEAQVVRLASEAVLRHLTAMVHEIGATSMGVTTYGQRGGRSTATAVSTFSMTA